METKEYHTVDKTTWAEGPWQTEVDKKQWADRETNLPCLIVRGSMGALCGYVGISKGHPLFGKAGYDATGELSVHGGITFNNFCQPGAEDHAICHVVSEGEDDHIWWLGFDCAHALDHMPKPLGYDSLFLPSDQVYRTQDFVEEQCHQLATQLAALALALAPIATINDIS